MHVGRHARAGALLWILAATPFLLGVLSSPTPLLTGLRFGVTPERTRVVFEFSRAGFRHRIATVNDTLAVVRCRGAQADRSLARETEGEGLVETVRIEAVSPSELAILLGLRSRSTARAFALGSEAGRPPRLVVDLEAAPGAPGTAGPPGTPGAAAGPFPPPAATTAPGGPAAAVPPPVAPRADAPAPALPRPRVVVIDPGHGGHDPGATARGLKEKDVCLDVARRVAEILNGAPAYRAYLTRGDDRFVPLVTRMRFAEQKDADLFVSIHVNAAKSRRASGAEVFFLSIGAATDRASQELARLENEADPDYVVAEDEELRGLPFAVDLRQSDTMMRSSRIAEVVLDLLSARRLAEPRGVKQAGFAVLKSYQVPSILVELGFVSSQSDRRKLQMKEHRAKLAEALAAGVREYFEKYAPLRAPGGPSGESGP